MDEGQQLDSGSFCLFLVLRHYRLDEFRSDEWVEVEDDKLPTQTPAAVQEERDADPLGIKRSIFE